MRLVKFKVELSIDVFSLRNYSRLTITNISAPTVATGFIDFNGFLICYGKSLQEEQDERDLRDAFRVLDKNKRGEIDVEDLRFVVLLLHSLIPLA